MTHAEYVIRLSKKRQNSKESTDINILVYTKQQLLVIINVWSLIKVAISSHCQILYLTFHSIQCHVAVTRIMYIFMLGIYFSPCYQDIANVTAYATMSIMIQYAAKSSKQAIKVHNIGVAPKFHDKIFLWHFPNFLEILWHFCHNCPSQLSNSLTFLDVPFNWFTIYDI